MPNRLLRPFLAATRKSLFSDNLGKDLRDLLKSEQRTSYKTLAERLISLLATQQALLVAVGTHLDFGRVVCNLQTIPEHEEVDPTPLSATTAAEHASLPDQQILARAGYERLLEMVTATKDFRGHLDRLIGCGDAIIGLAGRLVSHQHNPSELEKISATADAYFRECRCSMSVPSWNDLAEYLCVHRKAPRFTPTPAVPAPIPANLVPPTPQAPAQLPATPAAHAPINPYTPVPRVRWPSKSGQGCRNWNLKGCNNLRPNHLAKRPHHCLACRSPSHPVRNCVCDYIP